MSSVNSVSSSAGGTVSSDTIHVSDGTTYTPFVPNDSHLNAHTIVNHVNPFNFNKLRIADGDLVIVAHGGSIYQSHIENLVSTLRQWCNNMGLTRTMICTSGMGGDVDYVSVNVISADDVFEREILR